MIKKNLLTFINFIFNSHKKIIYAFVFFVTIIIGNLFFSAVPAFAMDMSGMPQPTEVVSPVLLYVSISLNVLGLILALISAFFIFLTIQEYKKSSVSATLVYFLNGTLILGAIRLLFILTDNKIINISDISLMTAWHLLFYYAVYMFLIAGKALIRLVNPNQGAESMAKATLFMLIGLIFTVLIFILVPVSDNYLVHHLQGTWFDHFGMYHFIAFIMAGFFAFYLGQIKKKFQGYIGIIATPFTISIGMLSLIHLWELLNENWKIIVVSDFTGELVERILWIPVFIFILIAFAKLRKLTETER